jgi:hypothetical protein
MGKIAASVGLSLMLLFAAQPAACLDPITLVLLRMLRDHAVSASLEAGVDSWRQPPSVMMGYANASAPAAGATESERLKTVIDESFLDLSFAQREAVHQGLMNALSDPGNAAMRATIVAEFTVQAKMFRDSYRVLNGLSQAEKRDLSVQAAAEYKKLPDPQRRQILDALQAGIPSLPQDLSAMMLNELRSVQ